ncbi:hypothetical protein, partial [Bacteroides fragilis]|uniref:hypothetical protein n=1 Tax=Bacteroides fragilis TaxID=817 RepID=UPI0022AA9359
MVTFECLDKQTYGSNIPLQNRLTFPMAIFAAKRKKHIIWFNGDRIMQRYNFPSIGSHIFLPKYSLGRFYKFNLSLANSQNLIKATANVILLS